MPGQECCVEKLHRFRRHALDVPVQFAVHAGEEVFQQQGNIVDPLAQRRDADRQHVQAVEEVLPEAAGGGQGLQVLIGGGDDADIAMNRGVAPDALELLFLQQPQQFRLRARRHIAHLVHEDRAAVGLLEFADAPPVGARESAALVAEQFAFQQRFRDGGAVDRQERGLAAAAVLVDRPGHQFLAGPALAEDQHGHVLRGDAADRLIEFLHGRRAAHQLIAFRLGLLLLVDRSPACG